MYVHLFHPDRVAFDHDGTDRCCLRFRLVLPVHLAILCPSQPHDCFSTTVYIPPLLPSAAVGLVNECSGTGTLVARGLLVAVIDIGPKSVGRATSRTSGEAGGALIQ